MSTKIVLISVGVLIHLALGFLLLRPKAPEETLSPITQEKYITEPKPVKLGKIPESAEIVYHQDGFVYVMDRNGENVTQITFGEPRQYEHVAISHDHRYVAGNQVNTGILYIYGLQNNTETKVLGFAQAGGGGMDWDPDGYVYFGAAKPNEAADIYKMKADGTKLVRLTNIPMVMKADVSVSPDGTLVAYVKAFPKPAPPKLVTTEIWLMNADGSNAHMVKRADRPGRPAIDGIADPEITDDNKRVIFSERNLDVPPNFPSISWLNTAHDIWIINIDGTNLSRITQPGPISIIPDWKDGWVLYNESSDKKNTHWDTALIRDDGTGYKIIRQGTGFAKWIPSK